MASRTSNRGAARRALARASVCASNNLESQISRTTRVLRRSSPEYPFMVVFLFVNRRRPPIPRPRWADLLTFPVWLGAWPPQSNLIVSSAMREAPQLDEQSHSVDETVQRRIMANTTPRLRGSSSSSRPGVRLLVQVERAATTRSRTCRARRSAVVSRALHFCAAPFLRCPTRASISRRLTLSSSRRVRGDARMRGSVPVAHAV